MKLNELRATLDRLEAEAGTNRILVQISHSEPAVFSPPAKPRKLLLDIGSISLATYRDGEEVNHVIWLTTSPMPDPFGTTSHPTPSED